MNGEGGGGVGTNVICENFGQLSVVFFVSCQINAFQ